MDKRVLLKIHDQCGKVQHSIVLNYDTLNNDVLANELSELHKLLGELLCF